MVRAEGLEPPRLSPPEPKSGASTSSATPAASAGLTRPICFRRSISACPLCAIEKYGADALDGSFAHDGCDGDSEEPCREQNPGCARRRARLRRAARDRKRPSAAKMAAKPRDVTTLRMDRPLSPQTIRQHCRRHAQRAKMGQMAYLPAAGSFRAAALRTALMALRPSGAGGAAQPASGSGSLASGGMKRRALRRRRAACKQGRAASGDRPVTTDEQIGDARGEQAKNRGVHCSIVRSRRTAALSYSCRKSRSRRPEAAAGS